MATKDKSSGLLSKMVQLIRPAAKDGRTDDESELGQDSEFVKKALKERIERKRADDSVRRREFNHLRKLRNASPLVGSYVVGGRPSIFQSSSGFGAEDRALTIKKIDDIEAHMSQNWSDQKLGNPPVRKPVARPLPPVVTQVHQATEPAPLLSDDDADYDFTKVDLTPAAPRPAPAKVPAVADEPTQAMPLESFKNSVVDTSMSGFSNSKLISIELVDSLGDPNLQDAAIRFAEGDDAGAEAALLAVIQTEEDQPGSADPCAAGLFDLLRGTGQKERFEAVALDYAQRFGRSPPEWFSTPDMLRQRNKAGGANGQTNGLKDHVNVWDCPADLTLPALQSLQASLKHAQQPWHLNWGQLQSMAPDAARSLATLFEGWCKQPVKLRFDGADVLESALRSFTPRGDPRVDQMWWHLRLDALRILRLHDEFEDAAMEFCLVYELSPPSWSEAKCQLENAEAHDAAGPASVFSDSSLGALAPADPVVELTGELQGDAVDVLHKLPSSVKRSERLTISCNLLIRIDFSAAGSILNWVAQRESEGCRVQFVDVPRLVAAFFTVIGINEHAKVVVRAK
jgi:ABC-type transporter Mla MlaB component